MRAEVTLEAGPYRLKLGRVRRRPLVYAAAAIVMAYGAWFWSDPRALWIAVGLAAVSALSILRAPAPDTLSSYAIDIAALSTGVVLIGLHPASAVALWSSLVLVAYFGLSCRQARNTLGLVVAAMAVTYMADGRWQLLDLSDTHRFRVGLALTAIGFAHLVTIASSLARAMRVAVGTAEEATEVQRRQAEFRATLASTVSHELRNPLAGIRGFVDVLAGLDEEVSAHERQEYLAIVASQTRALEGIVEDLLVAVQDEVGRMSVDDVEFDLGSRVHQVLRELGPGVVNALEVSLPDSLIARGDPLRVGQIVRNLVSNAQKYGGPGIAVSAAESGGFVRVVVSDDGPGIASDDADRIFEPFERSATGSSGYGLGLPISRRLARAMGGDLTYETGAESTTFVLTLPAP